MPEISAVILTCNSIGFIKTCLDSVFAQEYQNFEAIVVDNGSKDGTVNFIKKNYPQVTLLENEQNLGACKARNQGIEVACGKWILTLDCDIVLEKDFLVEIGKAIKTLPRNIGIIQPKMLNFDRETIYSCGVCLSWLRRFYDIGKGKKYTEQFDKLKYIFGACCATAVYNRKMLEEIREDTGYFDERFFFLVEDVDLSWRMQRIGWKAMFYPAAVCYHFGYSSGYNKKFRQYLCFRNRYLMIKKNETLSGKLRLIILSFWYEFLRIAHIVFTNKYLWKRFN